MVKEVPGKTTFVQSTYVVTFPVNSAEIGNTSELDDAILTELRKNHKRGKITNRKVGNKDLVLK